jgi:hypothetical protein
MRTILLTKGGKIVTRIISLIENEICKCMNTGITAFVHGILQIYKKIKAAGEAGLPQNSVIVEVLCVESGFYGVRTY